MNIIQTKHTPITIFLRLFLLASFLILPLSPTYTAHAKTPAGPTVPPVLATGTPLPRNETLYFNGLQWDPVNCWNPYSSNCNNAMAIVQQDNARVTMFETPYLYDMLDGKVYPLLADGPFAWNVAKTSITFKIKKAAYWSDGTPVTAADVAYTWATHVKYGTATGGGQDYINTIIAVDPQTVQVNAKLDSHGKALNPLGVAAYLSTNYVIQKAWTKKLEARNGYNATQLMADIAEDVVYSGPYHKFFADATKVVLVRDDNYWGKDVSMWGKLPVPKYLAHVIYADNNAGDVAFKAGNVDVSQQFITNVQDLWLVDHLPISTYLPNAPYDIGASLPTAFYNLASYGLDQLAIRKAIAIAVDYDSVVANAMTNQSATFEQVPRSLMNPSAVEQALYDHASVASLQWAGKDIAGAKALLDAAGIKDTNADGWREYNGTTLHYVATCPNGWTDWQAAIEQVAAAGTAIGIDITTNFPDWSVYQTVVTNWPLPAGYDIFMMFNDGAGPAEPWKRTDHLLNSAYAHATGNWTGNWGGYINPAADALINAIPAVTNPTTLKADYTKLTKIYLTDIPSFTLMYRPQNFHTVNETVWTGFPHQGDGTNPPVPPLDEIDGWAIAGLYNLVSVPTNVQASDGTYTTQVLVSWAASSGATSYKVYRASSAAGTKSLLGSPTVTTFDDTTAITGHTYYYWVTACNGANCSAYSAYNTGWRSVVPVPTSVQASDGTYTIQVLVSWAASSGATSYKVYRALSAAGTRTLLGSPTVTTFNDTTAIPGVTYYYWVVAYKGTGFSDFSVYNTGWRSVVPVPTSVQASDGTYTTKVLVSWNASSGATSYKVYRALSATGTRTLLGSPTVTTFNDTTAIPGVTYYYWVVAYKGTGFSDFSVYNTGWRELSPPTDVQASDGTYTTQVLVSWNASSAATSYKVYRATSSTGTKSLLGSPTGTTFNDTSATPGVTYYYWVVAYRGTSYSGYSAPNSGWQELSPPTNLQASDGTYTTQVLVTWTASSGATSYKVYRAASATGTKTLLGSPTGTTFNDTSATPGVHYYYWVVAYRGARYSAYSAPNSGWRKP